jgi:hypothetical protein
MHHNKLAKRAKQTDDQRLARREQFKELAKYVSKEFSASGTKLGVEEENYHTAAEYGSDDDDGMDLSTDSNFNFEENDVNSEDSNNGHVEDVTLPPENTIKSKFEAYETTGKLKKGQQPFSLDYNTKRKQQSANDHFNNIALIPTKTCG